MACGVTGTLQELGVGGMIESYIMVGVIPKNIKVLENTIRCQLFLC